MIRFCLLTLALLCVAATGGCGSQPQSLPPVELAPGPTPAAGNYTNLAQVLKSAVAHGRILPNRLAGRADDLDAQLRWFTLAGPSVSPQRFDSQPDRLAYWYNARAAWALKLALLCDCPERIARCQLQDRPFPIDGRMMTLEGIDAEILAQGGWKALVAAPGLCLNRAAMPGSAFDAADIDAAIGRRFNEFVNDPQRFVIDIAQREVFVPPVLWQFRDQLIAQHNQQYGTRGASFLTALLGHVRGSAHRRIQGAIGYDVASAPADAPVALGED